MLFRYLYMCAFFCVSVYLYKIYILAMHPSRYFIHVWGNTRQVSEDILSWTSVPALVTVWACCEDRQNRWVFPCFFLCCMNVLFWICFQKHNDTVMAFFLHVWSKLMTVCQVYPQYFQLPKTGGFCFFGILFLCDRNTKSLSSIRDVFIFQDLLVFSSKDE